jgi:hypothetical protein
MMSYGKFMLPQSHDILSSVPRSGLGRLMIWYLENRLSMWSIDLVVTKNANGTCEFSSWDAFS